MSLHKIGYNGLLQKKKGSQNFYKLNYDVWSNKILLDLEVIIVTKVYFSTFLTLHLC